MSVSGSRRWSGEWGVSSIGDTVAVDVLIPTCGRESELAVTLAGLAAQDDPSFRVIISDQSETGRAMRAPSVQSMIRVLRAQGRRVLLSQHLPRRGMAEQRSFLLEQAAGEFILFLDDDVWLEPGTLQRLHAAIRELDCGFVGSAVQGLSYLRDDRPQERESFSAWVGAVQPERMRQDAPGYDRWQLHNAANLAHEAARIGLPNGSWLAYRIAWVGGCVLYRRQALLDVGGFGFWPDLPVEHAGEDVAAEWRVMERFGGAGILPSGAVHLESPTTVRDRRVDAVDIVFGSGPMGTGVEENGRAANRPAANHPIQDQTTTTQ